MTAYEVIYLFVPFRCLWPLTFTMLLSPGWGHEGPPDSQWQDEGTEARECGSGGPVEAAGGRAEEGGHAV